jgi:hypothetical protein
VQMLVDITPMITMTVTITFTFPILSVNQRKHQTNSSKIKQNYFYKDFLSFRSWVELKYNFTNFATLINFKNKINLERKQKQPTKF